jgi:RNA polymerase sigma factor (sigma-70 family)
MGSPEMQLESVREPTVAELVGAAIAGEAAAWNAIVDRFAGLVWAIARRHRLSAADAADVSQTTWLRLVEHLERIEKPERIGAWLATTARHESLRVLRLADRSVPAPNEDFIDLTRADEPDVDAALLEADRDHELAELVRSLPPRCRELLQVLMSSDAPNYVEIGSQVGMPTGSIGPTRARCLERIRRLAASRGICLDRDDS